MTGIKGRWGKNFHVSTKERYIICCFKFVEFKHLTLTVPWYDVRTQWWGLHLALLEPYENIVGVQAPSCTPFLFWWRVEVPHTMLCPWWWCWNVSRWWIFHHELEFSIWGWWKPRLSSKPLPYINHSRAPNEEWCRLSNVNLAFFACPKKLCFAVGCWYGSAVFPNLSLILRQTCPCPVLSTMSTLD